MIILSIETSCDDTAISILECGGSKDSPSFRVLANQKISQEKKHAEYGGVYPNLAKNEHTKNLPIVLEDVMEKSQIEKPDFIAVTYGPGLEPSLWTGITFAKDLSEKWNIPIIPTNHMEGHVWSFFGRDEGEFQMPEIKYPTLALLVSGGHTQLVLVEEFGKYKILGETLDDAVGEAFDKVARMLDLPYPGGPQISALAEKARGENIDLRSLAQSDGSSREISQQRNIRAPKNDIFINSLPRPMMHSKNYNFSYSGLKTSVLYTVEKIENLTDEIKQAIALEFENAAIEPIVHKTKKAIEEFSIHTLLIGGGVAANKHLRNELEKNINIPLYFPSSTALSSDNSLMIGMVAWMNYLKNGEKAYSQEKIQATGKLKLK